MYFKIRVHQILFLKTLSSTNDGVI